MSDSQQAEVVSCIVCEGVRPELGGKATILGFGGVLPYVDMGIKDLPAKLSNLTLLILIKGSGSAPANLLILNPDGTAADPSEGTEIQLDWDGAGQVIGASIGLSGFVANQVGIYSVRFSLNERLIYESSFEISLAATE